MPPTYKVQVMSAAKGLDESTAHRLRYPMYESLKLDGIRCVIRKSVSGKPVAYSKTFKPIRSSFVQEHFAKEEYLGLDGELILGDPADPLVCNKTYSAVMTIGCNAPVDFYVFDKFDFENTSFETRLQHIQEAQGRLPHSGLHVIEQKLIRSWEEILADEQKALAKGYEGLILRAPLGPYKFGRSTLIENYLVKLKRIVEDDAQIIGFTELMINQNAPILDAMGYQKRSSSKEGKVPGNTLGTLELRDVKTGVEFEVGSGWDDAFALEVWNNKEKYLSRFCTYKHFPIGRVNKPRQPIFKCLRSSSDITLGV